jgi:hypothetical protein
MVKMQGNAEGRGKFMDHISQAFSTKKKVKSEEDKKFKRLSFTINRV